MSNTAPRISKTERQLHHGVGGSDRGRVVQWPLDTDSLVTAVAERVIGQLTAVISAELVQLGPMVAELAAKACRESIAELHADVNTDPNEKPTEHAPDKLLTLAQAQAARPALKRQWLYQHKAACGAVRANDGKRSPLLFTLAGIDAELARRRVRADNGGVRQQQTSSEPRRRRPQASDNGLTQAGNPRAFVIKAKAA